MGKHKIYKAQERTNQLNQLENQSNLLEREKYAIAGGIRALAGLAIKTVHALITGGKNK